jgi:hypothetical protein
MSHSKSITKKLPQQLNNNFEKKILSNGKPNPKYVDVLDEDKPISGCKFFVASFLEPEDILKKKDIFLFEEFLKTWEMNKSMEKFVQFLNFISYKYKIKFEEIMKDFDEFVKDEKESIRKSSMDSDYKNFIEKNEEELENKFQKAHNFRTSYRAVKVRGTYPTQEEAQMRAKLLRENDPSTDVHVGPVGIWGFWAPKHSQAGDIIYMEEELNQLMHEKNKNDAKAKNEHENRIKEAKQKAIEENIKNAKKTGNVLTQTINKSGNLVGIKEEQENELATVEEIKNELFEGENIVMGKSDNGASQLISGPFAQKSKKEN